MKSFVIILCISLTSFQYFPRTGKDIYSPEVESSPAPSSVEPQGISQGVKQTSRTNSFEIENLLKTAEQVRCLFLLMLFLILVLNSM